MASDLSRTDSPWQPAAACALIALVGVIVYANSFSAPFVFDGESVLIGSDTIHNVWPWKMAVGWNRPIGFLSFGLNYAVSGYNVWSYHAVNLAIHVAAACTLFGIVRRTLASGQMAPRFGRASYGFALAVALIWLVHPLQTQSVTYLYQRLESLMGLCYLVTLYAFIRAQTSARPGWWYTVSIVVCALGMGTKEVMVTAPVFVVWYDRVFVAASWRELFRQRWRYYACLAGTWGVLVGLIVGYTAEYTKVGLQFVSPIDYALSQPGVIMHYLRLSFWPSDLCLDYVWAVPRTASEILTPGITLLFLLAITLWCVFKRPVLGFVLGTFFLILSPTSSISPVLDLAFEHRMYLSLASVVVLIVFLIYDAWDRLFGAANPSAPDRARLARVLGAASVFAAVCVLGYLTIARNNDYRTKLGIWEDTVRKRPHNLRARTNLATAFFDEQNPDSVARGIDELNRVIAIGGQDALQDMGEEGLSTRLSAEAIRQALASAGYQNPHMSWAYLARARVRLSQNRPERAVDDCTKAIELGREDYKAYAERGKVRQRLYELSPATTRHLDDAIADYTTAIELNPKDAELFARRAVCLAEKKQFDDAWEDVRSCRQLGGQSDAGFLQKLEKASPRRTESDR